MSAETIISTVIGSLIGLAVNWFFAWRGGKELRAEAERLRQAVNVLGRAMEEEGWASINRDENGNMTGLTFTRHLSGTQPAPSGSLTARHTRVVSSDPRTDDSGER